MFPGAHGSCAVLDAFSLECVGENAFGLLGLGDTNGRPSCVEVTPVDLGPGMTVKQVRSAGEEGGFACAVLGNDTVKCWGRGEGSRLGNGGGAHLGDGPGEMGDALPVTLTR